MAEKMYAESEVVELVKSAIADRAKWFALFAKYIPQEQFDAVAAKAVWDFGYAKRHLVPGPNKEPSSMADCMASGFGAVIFQTIKYREAPKEVVVRFHHCPLIRGWEELGCTKEQIAHYCDLICNGDYGQAKSLELCCEFTQIIAHGDPVCELHLTPEI